MGELSNRLAQARAALAAAEERVGVRKRPLAAPGGRPVPTVLHGLLGARRLGVAVSGSSALLLQVWAAAMRADDWGAIVGFPTLGWDAAREAGIDLGRVVAVPDPGSAAARVLGVLSEVGGVLVVGPTVQLSAPQQRTIGQKLWRQEGFLLSAQAWPGVPHVVAQKVTCPQLGLGEGRIAGASWRVTRADRPGYAPITVAWDGDGLQAASARRAERQVIALRQVRSGR
ncbi:hypothetical protein [Buchananella hordeovulneris]|uniref:hypothetical protein n=1 Tax=Buchananella hordeovulneris TaxID=52770 RepID=UPI000F93E189|nr:hypothetical protein [Buchananella hordeovulneris]RRD45512.1 hypothetical protein EII13_01230 [Buchananella hordeovulneris]